MRLRRLLCLAGALAALACPKPASAQDRAFSRQHPLVISVEDVAGFWVTSFQFAGEDEDDVYIFGTDAGLGLIVAPLPRLGVHYFVAGPVSLGAGLHYSDNEYSEEVLLFAPRVGVALPVNDGTAFWLRAGAGYLSWQTETREGSDVLVGGEALLVLQPVEHFGFLLGVRYEVGVAGKERRKIVISGSAEREYDWSQVGATFGIAADL